MGRYGMGMAVVMLFAAFAGGFVAQWMLGCRTVGAQVPAADVVRARGFVVVDAAGRDQVMLGSNSDCTGLVVKDGQAVPRLRIGLLPKEQVGLVIANAAQETQMALGASAETNHLDLYDNLGKPRFTVGVDREMGNSGLYFYDEDKVPRLAIGIGPRGGGDFVMRGYDGNDVWRASWDMRERGAQ